MNRRMGRVLFFKCHGRLLKSCVFPEERECSIELEICSVVVGAQAGHITGGPDECYPPRNPPAQKRGGARADTNLLPLVPLETYGLFESLGDAYSPPRNPPLEKRV